MPSVARAGGAAAGVDDPLVGVVLDGRYRIESRLARGGMSTVFTGTDLRLDRSVALKVMDAQLAGDPQFAGRFAREARAAARLSHVNVVAVHDQGEDAGHAFLVMELVRGRTLRDLIREHGRVSPELAIAITEPVLAALAAAHRAHLVHRDIKPENVLLGDDGVVKVADFGLARALADLSSTAENSAVMGTAAYVAPEQITRGATTPRTDVYSTGIVLFEMVTGRAPFAGGSSVSTAYRHVHEDVPAPSARVAGLPRALDALVVRATRRDPAARPADAAEFLARLHDARHAAGLRRVPVPPRLPVRDRTPDPALTAAADEQRTRVHRGLAATAIVTTTTPADGAPAVAPANGATTLAPRGRVAAGPRPARRGGAHPLESTAEAAQAWPERQRRHRRRFLLGVAVILVLALAACVGGWWLGDGRFTTVPKLTDLTTSEALAAARHGDLKLTVASTRTHSETVPAGYVARTDPRPGERAHRGATVTAVVSAGPERYRLPAGLVGDRAAAVRVALGGYPLRVEVATTYDEHVARGVVTAVDPRGGTVVRRGEVVIVHVSAGPTPFEMLDVTGQDLPTAQASVLRSGMRVAVQRSASDTVPPGMVISTQPAAASVVHRGAHAVLTVSTGPAPVAVPDVRTMTIPEAESMLEAQGFTVQVHQLWGWGGTVSSQTPAAGEIALHGTPVQITTL